MSIVRLINNKNKKHKLSIKSTNKIDYTIDINLIIFINQTRSLSYLCKQTVK